MNNHLSVLPWTPAPPPDPIPTSERAAFFSSVCPGNLVAVRDMDGRVLREKEESSCTKLSLQVRAATCLSWPCGMCCEMDPPFFDRLVHAKHVGWLVRCWRRYSKAPDLVSSDTRRTTSNRNTKGSSTEKLTRPRNSSRGTKTGVEDAGGKRLRGPTGSAGLLIVDFQKKHAIKRVGPDAQQAEGAGVFRRQSKGENSTATPCCSCESARDRGGRGSMMARRRTYFERAGRHDEERLAKTQVPDETNTRFFALHIYLCRRPLGWCFISPEPTLVALKVTSCAPHSLTDKQRRISGLIWCSLGQAGAQSHRPAGF